MSFFELDRERCCKDALCALECPGSVIIMDPETGYPALRPRGQRGCIDCGHCMAVCPTAAIRVAGRGYEDFPALVPELESTSEQALQFLQSRRSVRNFKKELLPDTLLDAILDATRFAPTAGHRQPVRWIVSATPEKNQTIAALVAAWMADVPAESPFAGRRAYYRAVATIARNGADPILRGAPCLAIAYTEQENNWTRADCAIALTYAELAAHALGVGACWAGYFTAAVAEYAPLREFLGLEPGNIVGGAQMLGFPGASFRRLPRRGTAPVRRL